MYLNKLPYFYKLEGKIERLSTETLLGIFFFLSIFTLNEYKVNPLYFANEPALCSFIYQAIYKYLAITALSRG